MEIEKSVGSLKKILEIMYFAFFIFNYKVKILVPRFGKNAFSGTGHGVSSSFRYV